MKALRYPSLTPALSLGSFLVLACAAWTQPAYGQSSGPRFLYQWSFERGGSPSILMTDRIRGGELTPVGGNVDLLPSFRRHSGGVSDASPGVLDASRNYYGSTEGAQVTSFGSNLFTGTILEQFTITMWIKASLPIEMQPLARLINIGPVDSEQGKNSVLIALESTEAPGIAFLVNNSAYYRVDLKEPVIQENEWVFLVFVYDGLTDNAHYSPPMGDRFKSPNNGAILAGGLNKPTHLVTGAAVHTGAPSYSATPGKIQIDGLQMAIGSSNVLFDRSFVGWIDDVRIYSGLLTMPELDRVRLEAMGK